MTPFQAVYGRNCLLPIEHRVPTWSTLPWSEVRNRSELLTLRSIQLLQRDKDLVEAALRVKRLREQGKGDADQTKGAVDRAFKVNELVFSHETRYKDDFSSEKKLWFWWSGPYRVTQADHEKGFYRLGELDGVEMEGTRLGRRLKPYNARTEDANSKYREIMRAQEQLMDDAESDSGEDEISGAGFRILIPLQGKMPDFVNPNDNYRDSEDGEGGSGGSEDNE